MKGFRDGYFDTQDDFAVVGNGFEVLGPKIEECHARSEGGRWKVVESVVIGALKIGVGVTPDGRKRAEAVNAYA